MIDIFLQMIDIFTDILQIVIMAPGVDSPPANHGGLHHATQRLLQVGGNLVLVLDPWQQN